MEAVTILYAYTNTNILYDLYCQNHQEKLLQLQHDVLETFKVNKYDREYQIGKREPLSIELFTEKRFMQKLHYVHQNLVAAGLVNCVEEYKYSSAKFYLSAINEFNIITHYKGN